jgi:hypothetical protein
MDAEFSTKISGNTITLKCHKAKDFEAPSEMYFEVKQVDLGADWLDDDGKQLTSVYVEVSSCKGSLKQSGKLRGQNKVVLASLDQAIRKYGEDPTVQFKSQFGDLNQLPIMDGQKIVNLEQWREEVYIALGDKRYDTKRIAFDRGRERLLEQGYILEQDGYFWRATGT